MREVPKVPENPVFDPEERLDHLVGHLGTRMEGPSEWEVDRPLRQYGLNKIQCRQGASRLREVARQFTHLLALLLWVAAAPGQEKS